MFYIHDTTCISHQPTFDVVNLDDLNPSENNLLHAIEPKYEGIPIGQLRRMGRALRMGVGAGMKLLTKNNVNGILIGTANGGIEDSIVFLNQIHDYEEGRLTPTAFVQSTYNAIAGMLGMITGNRGYNATHVHRGQSFENTALDASMLLTEHPDHIYLIGAVDEISPKNHRLVSLAGWYRSEPTSNANLYQNAADGTLPGEGAAMFIVNNLLPGARAKLRALSMVNTTDEKNLSEQLTRFIQQTLAPGEQIDLFLHGENGDNRLLRFYEAAENCLPPATTAGRFKHMFGEFQSVSALALWLAVHILQTQKIPQHVVKKEGTSNTVNRILIYNNYQGVQHSFMLVEQA